MKIIRNEWDTLEQAIQALEVFPFCGDCKRGLKLHQIRGHIMVQCSGPHKSIHFGMSDWKEGS